MSKQCPLKFHFQSTKAINQKAVPAAKQIVFSSPTLFFRPFVTRVFFFFLVFAFVDSSKREREIDEILFLISLFVSNNTGWIGKCGTSCVAINVQVFVSFLMRSRGIYVGNFQSKLK